jgi:hypothetical protein
VDNLIYVSITEFKKHVPGLSRQTIRRMAREGALAGQGTDDDPVRTAYLYFTKDGKLIGQLSN